MSPFGVVKIEMSKGLSRCWRLPCGVVADVDDEGRPFYFDPRVSHHLMPAITLIFASSLNVFYFCFCSPARLPKWPT